MKVAHEICEAWRVLQERQPLHFFDRVLLPELVRALWIFAPWINAQPNDLVFMQNATTGLNTVFASLERTLKPGDEVLATSLGYGAVKTMLKRLCERSGAVYREVAIELPLASPEAIVDLVRPHLNARTKLAVFDHVTSNSALIMPVEKLATLCAGHGAAVVSV